MQLRCRDCGETSMVTLEQYKAGAVPWCGACAFVESLSAAQQDHYLQWLEDSMKAQF